MVESPAKTRTNPRFTPTICKQRLWHPWAKCGQIEKPAAMTSPPNDENPRMTGGFRW